VRLILTELRRQPFYLRFLLFISKRCSLKFNNLPIWIFAALLGACSFLLIYGSLPLNVQYDKWIANGYVESDILQHYAGWLSYRGSSWHFPIGFNDYLNVPNGSLISFTDSLPLMSIFFKLFADWLPSTFQFFGWYIFLCFILQGISSALLLSKFTRHKITILLGSALFIFSPIMIERAFRHTALASHFLIIFALNLFFKARRENYRLQWPFLILSALAIMIHPYFVPMVLGILFISLVERCSKKFDRKTIACSLIFLMTNFGVVLLIGLIIGVFGFIYPDFGEGYGFFSMNLNAIINPFSACMTWSKIFKPLPRIFGNCDGFNYLGLGVLFFSSFLLFHLLVSNNFLKDKAYLKKIGSFLQDNYILLLGLICFTLFAISNVVTCNHSVLLEITLPKLLKKITSPFRSSGRMFYPVYYSVFLGVLVGLIRYFPKNKNALIVCLIVVQLFDVSPALKVKQDSFNRQAIETNFSTNPYYHSKLWSRVARNKNLILLNAPETPDIPDYNSKRGLVLFVMKKGMRTNLSIDTWGNLGFYQVSEDSFNRLVKGDYEQDTAYIFTPAVFSKEKLEALLRNLNSDLARYHLNKNYDVIMQKKFRFPRNLIKKETPASQ